MSQPALIIIDMLNDYFREAPLRDHRRRLVDAINQLSQEFRRLNLPVVWVRQEFSPDLRDAFPEMRRNGTRVTIAGSEGAKVLNDLERSSGDYEIIKKRYSAFYKTGLEVLITKTKANPLFLAGVNTHACIRMTAIDAYQRDLEVIIARECVDSYDEEHQRITLRYLDGKIAQVLSNPEIMALISPPGGA